MSQHRLGGSSPSACLSLPSEQPVKKKRKSPLFSKAKLCVGCCNAKLRCDMTWPCANCVRRGLTQDCPGFVPHEQRTTSLDQPNGTIDSARSVASLAHTATIESERRSTTQLEADDTHNALAPTPMQRQVDTTIASGPNSSGGLPQYYGQSAHSSYLASNFSPQPQPQPQPPPQPPSDDRMNLTGPGQPRRAGEDSRVQLDTDYKLFLDHVQEGMDESMVEDFRSSIAWMFCPIEVSKLRSVFNETEDDAAALCLVIKVVMFAWQAALQQDHSTGSERIREVAFQLCWRKLDKAQWSRNNSLAVQQALFMLCIFLLNFEGGRMSDRFSSIFGICVSKAVESGLYTDAKVGQADDHSVQHQWQRLFWELYSLDAFRSLAYCRPCFFQDSTITALKPSVLTDDDAFHAIKYENVQFINCFMTHHLHSFHTNFQETMDLDLQVRQLFERIPSHLRVRRANRLSSGRQQSVRQILQGCTIALNIHQTLLTLYRPWFVSHTLEEAQGKGDRHVTQHQRAKLCIGESASAMIDLCSCAYAVDLQTTMHWAFFLHHTFNAGVCRAMQAIYSNASDPLYYSAVDEVDEAMALLEKTQDHGCGEVWLPRAHVLRKLRQRIDRMANGATRNGEQSRRASYFGLLGATVPLEPERPSRSPTHQELQLGGDYSVTAILHSNNIATATPDETASALGWLNLLNTDAFTLPMADLWNAESLSLLNSSVNADQLPDAAWSTPLYQ